MTSSVSVQGSYLVGSHDLAMVGRAGGPRRVVVRCRCCHFCCHRPSGRRCVVVGGFPHDRGLYGFLPLLFWLGIAGLPWVTVPDWMCAGSQNASPASVAGADGRRGTGLAGSGDSGGGWRVFISHTSELRDFPAGASFVAAVERAVSACGHVIVDMADFPAADQVPAEQCVDQVRGCDVYVGVWAPGTALPCGIGPRCPTPS